MDIEIWLSGLEHRNNFKPVVSRINTMCNPILFAIPHNLWTPYQNFRVFSWYNGYHYEWLHRHIFSTYNAPWMCYKYYKKASM